MNNINIDVVALFILISWFAIGFLVMVGVWIHDMRNKEYNENYFDVNCALYSTMIFAFGYVSLANI